MSQEIRRERSSSRWLDDTKRVWWVSLTLVPFGWLAFAAFGYAGWRANVTRWKTWAFVYFVVFWTATVIASVQELPYPLRQAGGLVMLFAWPVPVIHALRIRREYLRKVDNKPHSMDLRPESAAWDADMIATAERIRAQETERREYARRVRPKVLAWTLVIAGGYNALLGVFRYDFHVVQIAVGSAVALLGAWLLRRNRDETT